MRQDFQREILFKKQKASFEFLLLKKFEFLLLKKFEFLLSKKFEILLLRKNLQLFSRADFRLLSFLFKKEILEGNDFSKKSRVQ